MNKSLNYIILFCAAISLFSNKSLAQTADNKNGFAINQNLHDYNISLLDKKVASFDSSLSQSFRVSYWRYLSRSFSFNSGISNGFLFYQQENGQLINKSYFIGVDAVMQYNIFNGTLIPENARIKPFVSYGNSLNYINKLKEMGGSPWGFSNQYGLGLQIKLAKRTSLRIESAIDQEIGKSFDTHMQYRLGFIQTISTKKEEKEEPPKKDSIPDYDADGVADVDDECPTIPGLVDNYGCPDDYVSSADEKAFIDSLNNSIADILDEIQDLRDSINYLKENQPIVIKYRDKPGTPDNNGGIIPDNSKNPDSDNGNEDPKNNNGDKNNGNNDVPDNNVNPSQPIADDGGRIEGGIIIYDPIDPQDQKGGQDNNNGNNNKSPKQKKTGNKKIVNEPVYADNGRTDDEHPGIIIYDQNDKIGSVGNLPKQKSGKPTVNNNSTPNRNSKTKNYSDGSSNQDFDPNDYSYPPLYTKHKKTGTFPQNSDNKAEQGYYVIAISTKNKGFAERTAEVLRQTYPIVEVLPNNNGFYRVGIYATRTRTEANKILKYALEHGLPYAWVSKQGLVFN